MIEIAPELLPVESLAGLSETRRAALLGRGRGRLHELREPVTQIIEEVRVRGDAALLDFAERFDGARPLALRVPQHEIDAALAAADPVYVAALRQAIANIEAFHRAQGVLEAPVETTPGVRVWRVWRPMARVGIYVPGGAALYPSCLLMGAVPARVAGCAEIVICTPAHAQGHVAAPVLAAAALAGVTEVYAVGGAQAVAAMAYGTETLRRVDKIFGAGGSYVMAAKSVVSSEVAIDLPAGPSEVLVVADASADPAWVASDLLAQAEHVDAACVLVATSPALAGAVRVEMVRQLPALASAPVIRANLARNGALLVASDMDAALDFANAYGAEHLQLLLADAEQTVERITHAGSVFLGGWSPTAAGDYATGGNHTLPTAGYARGFGPLSLEAFGRKMQVQRLSAAGLQTVRATIETLATTEGLPAHAASIRARFDTPSANGAADDGTAGAEGTR